GEVRVQRVEGRGDRGGVAAAPLLGVVRLAQALVQLVLGARPLHVLHLRLPLLGDLLRLYLRLLRGFLRLVHESHCGSSFPCQSVPPNRLPSGLLAFSSWPRCAFLTMAWASDSIVIDCRSTSPSPSSVAWLKPLPPNRPLITVARFSAPMR